MKFPGSKLLHRFDLAARETSLEDLFRSSRSSGLTGMIEVTLPGAIGLIFYYLGAEVNAMYREGSMAWSGQAALKHLGSKVFDKGGSVAVFELPLDLAHLLRGIARRQRTKDEVKDKSGLLDLLRRLEKGEHTGTLEVHTPNGAAMVLLVRGRVSNHYFDATDGETYEKGEARTRIEEAVGAGGPVQIFLGDFSRDAWKARHEVLAPVRSRLERPAAVEPSSVEIAREEVDLRRQAVDALQSSLPGVLQALIVDLLTGVVLARAGRGAADVNLAPIAELVPGLVLHVRGQLEASDADDELEFLELSTARVTTLVAVVASAQEAMAILADRAQPTAPLGAALLRAARDYAARLAPSQKRGTLPPGARPASAIRRA
jgi:hypothetical protein